MTQKVLTVSQLNEYIKMLLDGQPLLSGVYVKGEISNFTNHRTGHWYFTLKDEGSLIRAVMFRGSNVKIPFLPENGMKVIVRGRVSAFVRDGQYQIYVDEMQPDGIGGLYLAYQQLKDKLEGEGLFDAARKKALPRIPETVGVITSPTGAAVRDIINITGRRFPSAKILLYPAIVQGDLAPSQLISGIRYFNETKSADVIIIGRGGGSEEDLWGFNDEALAREVAASEIPVISAVGHETDFTICDFAADRRAATPSAAAELAVPDSAELKSSILGAEAYLSIQLKKKLDGCRESLLRIKNSRVMSDRSVLLNERKMTLLHLSQLLDRAESAKLTEKKHEFAKAAEKLGALNPLAVLSRGYGAVENEDGRLVLGARDLKKNMNIKIRFADGEAKATVSEVYTNE
ncbi:MAG: exodeoxyribonuclease VII large subunit [Ruminococcaceae bacterium]|nr:exodeoxyribonuclease VII large subunit [Oscillospiraceae bacterium]